MLPKRTIGDYAVWYQPCRQCGYDEGKSSIPKKGNKTCWRCGSYIYRDYTERALKPELKDNGGL